MKRLNYLMNGLAALALIVLFAQCAGNTDKQTTNAPAQAGGLSENEDCLCWNRYALAKYNYCIDLNEAMVKKGENVRLTLNQKAANWRSRSRNSRQSIRTTLIFLRREHSRNTTALQSWSRICRTWATSCSLSWWVRMKEQPATAWFYQCFPEGVQ